MRKAFQSFFPPSEDFFDSLWRDSLVVLDTNVLLDMYRYSEGTRRDFFALFEKIADRLWIPHQVGLEFSRNRPTVIGEQVQMLQKSTSLLASLRETTAKEIEKIFSFRLHPLLSKDEFKKAFEDPLAVLEKKIDDYTISHPDLLKEDPILESLLTLLEGRVGASFEDDRLQEIFKNGKNRYEKGVPPGYEDARGPNKKEGDSVYGDLVIWSQIIECVKVKKAPGVIFICNDMKEDWWWFSKGRNLGCRPELREELYNETGAIFHIYTSERFLNHAPGRIKIKVKEESIDEVRTLEKENREASERADGAFSGSLVDRILKDQERREKALRFQPNNLHTLMEENLKRQEDMNRMFGANIGQSVSFASLIDQVMKDEAYRKNAFSLLCDLGWQKNFPGITLPSWNSLLGSQRGFGESPTGDDVVKEVGAGNEDDSGDSNGS